MTNWPMGARCGGACSEAFERRLRAARSLSASGDGWSMASPAKGRREGSMVGEHDNKKLGGTWAVFLKAQFVDDTAGQREAARGLRQACSTFLPFDAHRPAMATRRRRDVASRSGQCSSHDFRCDNWKCVLRPGGNEQGQNFGVSTLHTEHACLRPRAASRWPAVSSSLQLHTGLVPVQIGHSRNRISRTSTMPAFFTLAGEAIDQPSPPADRNLAPCNHRSKASPHDPPRLAPIGQLVMTSIAFPLVATAIRHFIALIMAYLQGWTPQSVAVWRELKSYRLVKTYHCKNTNSSTEHEFVIFELVDEHMNNLMLRTDRHIGARKDTPTSSLIDVGLSPISSLPSSR